MLHKHFAIRHVNITNILNWDTKFKVMWCHIFGSSVMLQEHVLFSIRWNVYILNVQFNSIDNFWFDIFNSIQFINQWSGNISILFQLLGKGEKHWTSNKVKTEQQQKKKKTGVWILNAVRTIHNIYYMDWCDSPSNNSYNKLHKRYRYRLVCLYL